MSSTTPNSDKTETETDDRATRRHIAPLIARRRQNLHPNNAHVSPEKHTHADANGDKIHLIEASRLLLLREYYPRENGGDNEKPPETDETTRERGGSVAVAAAVVVRGYYNMLTIRACYDVSCSYDEHVLELFDSRLIADGGERP